MKWGAGGRAVGVSDGKGDDDDLHRGRMLSGGSTKGRYLPVLLGSSE